MRAVERVLGQRGTLQRQYALASGLLAILVLGIILLFGHFLSQSLSRRYLEDTLISGRAGVAGLADDLALGEGNEDIYDVVRKRREEIVRTLSGLPQRIVFESFEVRDPQGKVVMTSTFEMTEALPKAPLSSLELGGEIEAGDVVDSDGTYQIAVPLGQIGEMVVSLSRERLTERVQQVRSELLRNTLYVAGLTTATLLGALMLVWHMIQATRRLETQRHEAQEMATLGALAANLAHEIRNPLNSINLNLEMLGEDLSIERPGESNSTLASTRQEVSRLARLVSDFLSYARPAPPKQDVVHISPLVQDAVDFLRAEARERGVHLRLAPDMPCVAVRGDSAQLRQVFFNLVLNSVQAVAPLAPERRVIEISGDTEDSTVFVGIRDRGNGIPASELERVRAAFVSRRAGGSGLGLAIADRIVKAHGGAIHLANLQPQGFEAVIVLPMHSEDAI
ncbi:MAG: hypothetical protein GY906_09935 [bacterium]|nr:hypothetical protein [bacterium]